jgi:hypothetical protein
LILIFCDQLPPDPNEFVSFERGANRPFLNKYTAFVLKIVDVDIQPIMSRICNGINTIKSPKWALGHLGFIFQAFPDSNAHFGLFVLQNLFS